MDQHIAFLATFLDEIKSRAENKADFLVEMVLDMKGHMLEMFWELELYLSNSTNCLDLMPFKFFDVPGKMAATDPDLS